jgi:hypothetical protein
MGFLVAAALVAGVGLSRLLWSLEPRAEAPGPFERALSVGLLSVASWVASNWALALTSHLTARGLVVSGVAMAGIGSVLIARFRKAATDARESAARPVEGARGRVTAAVLGLALSPAVLWVLFILWRGWILPVLSEDGLIYHMPKAVYLMRAGGFRFFDATDLRISCFPANYELLLSDFLILTGTDRATEWIATLAYVLFMLAAAALAERWWGRGVHCVAVALVAGAMPIALLHSGAHKHDFLMNFCSVAAILWIARWATEGGFAPLALAVVALAVSAGTKMTTASVIVGVAPLVVVTLVRRLKKGAPLVERPAAVAFLAVVGVLFLGGVAYAANWTHTGTPFGPNISGSAPAVFGAARHRATWQLPYLILTVPFSSDPNGVWVPWAHEYWFWLRYDLNLSHWGPVVSLLALALPFSLVLFRGDVPSRREERRAAGLTFLLAFLPACLTPLPLPGNFTFFARYLAFVPVAIAGFTVAPLVLRAPEKGVLGRFTAVLVLGGAFAAQAVEYGSKDAFAPFSYVLQVAAEKGESRTIFRSQYRAASVVDRIAGPDDVIAFDAGHDSWIYPAYGLFLERDVRFMREAPGPVEIPPEAKFVAVDRVANTLWGAKGFDHMGHAASFLWRGTPTANEVKVRNQLAADARWVQVFSNPPKNQAVFVRRDVYEKRVGRPPDSGRP